MFCTDCEIKKKLFKIQKDKSDATFGKRNSLLGIFCFWKIFYVNGHKIWILFSVLCRLGINGLSIFVIYCPRSHNF